MREQQILRNGGMDVVVNLIEIHVRGGVGAVLEVTDFWLRRVTLCFSSGEAHSSRDTRRVRCIGIGRILTAEQ